MCLKLPVWLAVIALVACGGGLEPTRPQSEAIRISKTKTLEDISRRSVNSEEAFGYLKATCGATYPSFRGAKEKALALGFVQHELEASRHASVVRASDYLELPDRYVRFRVTDADGKRVCSISYESSENSVGFSQRAAQFGPYIGREGYAEVFNYLGTGHKLRVGGFGVRITPRATLSMSLTSGE
jgi:hypothetical protein